MTKTRKAKQTTKETKASATRRTLVYIHADSLAGEQTRHREATGRNITLPAGFYAVTCIRGSRIHLAVSLAPNGGEWKPSSKHGYLVNKDSKTKRAFARGADRLVESYLGVN